MCNACGDKWTSGTLGDLAAPGAASKPAETEPAQTDGQDGEDKRAESQTGDDEANNSARTTSNSAADPNPNAIQKEEVVGKGGDSDELSVPADERVVSARLDDQSKTASTPAIEGEPAELLVDTSETAHQSEAMEVDPTPVVQIDSQIVAEPRNPDLGPFT